MFFYKKFIFKEGPRISSENLSVLHAKKEIGEKDTLDVKGMVDSANQILSNFDDRMSSLPKASQVAIKDNLVKYFLNAADSFDKDAEKGLDKIEFGKYKKSMMGRMIGILNKYVPSKEQIAARKALIEKKKKSAERLSKLVSEFRYNEEASKFNPANLQTPQGINKEMQKLHFHNSKLAEAAQEISTKIQDARQEYFNYQNLSAFEKGRQSLSNRIFGNSDQFEADATVTSVNESIKELQNPKVLSKIKKQRDGITKYGAFMLRAGKLMRVRIENARSKALLMAASNPDQSKANKEKYEKYKKIKEKLIDSKKKLTETRTIFLMKMMEGKAHASDKMHKKATVALDTASDKIKDMMQNPNLSEKQRKKLGVLLENLENRRDGIEKGVKTKRNEFLYAEVGIKRQFVDSYVDKAFNPSIENIDQMITYYETQQLSNGSPVEKIQAEFGTMLDGVEGLNGALNKTVMNLNITNSLMINNLENSIKGLKKVKSMGVYSSLMHSFGHSGTMLFKDLIADNLSEWGNEIDKIGGPLKSIGGLFNVVAGISESTGELVEGLSSLAANPKAAAVGLGALFLGRNPKTGKWFSGSTYANSWKELGKAMISAKEFEQGQYGKGIGKVMFNVLLTVTGAGAAAKGVKGAKEAYLIARNTLFKTRMVALTRAAGAFTRDFGIGIAEGFHNIGTKFAIRTVKVWKLVTTGRIVSSPLKAVARMMKAIPGKISEAEWLARIAKHQGLAAALGTTEFYKTMSRLKKVFRASKQIRKEIKVQRKLNRRIIANADDATRFEKELAIKAEKGLKRPDAIKAARVEHPKLYKKWQAHGQAEALLEIAKESMATKMLGKDLATYRRNVKAIGTYADDVGKMSKKLKEYGIDLDDIRAELKAKYPNQSAKAIKLLARKKALMKFKAQAQGFDKMLAEEWLANHTRFGGKVDDMLAIQKEIKEMRGESYLDPESLIKTIRQTDPALAEAGNNMLRELQNARKRLGIDENAASRVKLLEEKLAKWARKQKHYLENPNYRKFKDIAIKAKLDELMRVSGVNLQKELQLMDKTLYFTASGIKKWNFGIIKGNNYQAIQSALNRHLDQFARGKYAQLGKSEVSMIKRQLGEVIEEAKAAGVKGEDLARLLDDSADKLLYQTIHAAGRQLGDHGIRHIAGNIRANLKAMEAYEEAGIHFTAKDRLEMMIAHMNHDLGYTTSVALKSFSTTKAHPMISAAFLLEDKKMAPLLKRVLGEHSYRRMVRGVLNHDGAEVLKVVDVKRLERLKALNPAKYKELMRQYKYNAMLNSMKYADNLALFSFDKLPPIFYKDPVCLKILGEIDSVSSTGNSYLITSLRAQMKKRIMMLREKGEITHLEAQWYMNAIDEVNTFKTAESTLGMLAGQHGEEMFSLLPNPKSGRLIPHLRLEGSPVFSDIEDALSTLKGKKATTAAERMRATSTFDGSTQQFMKMMEEYAEKNGCAIKIGGKFIYKEGKVTQYGLDYLRQGIREGKTLELVKDSKQLMTVELRTSSRSLSEIDDAFSTATNINDRNLIAKRAASRVEREIKALDKRIKSASLEQETALLKQRQELLMQQRQLHDMEVSTDILKDRRTMRIIKTLREFKERLIKGDSSGAEELGRRLTSKSSGLTYRQRVTINKIRTNTKLSGRAKILATAHAILEIESDIFDRLLSKYKVESSFSKHNIIKYVKAGAGGLAGAGAVYASTS